MSVGYELKQKRAALIDRLRGFGEPVAPELDKGIITKVITIKVIIFTIRQAYAVSRART